MNKTKGILCTVLSAVIFGFTPILARIAYDGGSNGITMTFLRGLLSLPVLYLLVRRQGLPISVSHDELVHILLAGVFGTSLTTLMLYSSYSCISVGMATTLHFIYPILTSLCCVLFFRERMNLMKLGALVFASAGIFTFIERNSSAAVLGVALALLSGVSYTFYIVYTDKSGLKNIYFIKLTFYLSLTMTASSGLFGLATNQLTFSLTPKAWFYSLLVSLFASLGGVALFQLGILYVGASTCAILSTLEPITSVLLGVLLLGEQITPLKAGGCALILISILMIALSESKKLEPK